MSKRKWTNIKAVELEIQALREAGWTRQEIANKLGLEKEQVKNWIARHNRKERDQLFTQKRECCTCL